VITIRPEEPRDFPALRELQLKAFAPSEYEADVVDALRAAHDQIPGLCLVALDGDAIVGHVVLSHARVDVHPALGLGPIAVDPERQNEGIGTALMQETIERASRTEYPLIALLGHPAYYPRFGFRPAEATFAITTSYDAPPEAWMVHPLPAYDPVIRGAFEYAEAFGAQ
jgi:putative acetyltransferase